MNNKFWCLSAGALFSISCFAPLSANAFQPESAAPAAVADEAASGDEDTGGRPQEDPLAGEGPVGTRLTADANRLNSAIGEGTDLSSALARLFNADGSVGDEDRLKAAAELRQVMSGYDQVTPVSPSVARQLTRRADLAEAAVRSMMQNGATDSVRKMVDELLIRAAVDYESDVRKAHTSIVRDIYRQLREQAPAIYSDISATFARDYFNYNLHFVLSEPMMTRLVSDYRTESGAVEDCILGAWVTGSQVTDTLVQTDIKPSRNSAMFDLKVFGRTLTDTSGRKSPATIYSKGNHRFVVTKPTFFDGQNLSGAAAEMDVKMNTRTVGVSTDYDGVPILGGFARGIAADQAQQKQPQANAIAARKMANRVLPEFEQEIAQKFSEANENIQTNILGNLRKRGILPNVFSARSSETHMAVSSRTVGDATLAAPRAPEAPAPRRGLTIQMHQSALNAAIDSLGISGQMNAFQIIERIEDALSDLINREVTIDKTGVGNDTVFDFSDYDPIRVRFDEGAVVIIMRTGFIQPNRKVARHRLEIPFPISVADGKINITTPAVKDGGAGWSSRSLERGNRAIARLVIGQLIKKTFPEPVISKDSTHKVDMGDGSTLSLRTTRLQCSDGWLTVVMQ